MTATAKPGKLMDAGTIMAELGIKRAGAEALMRELPKVRIEGHRAAYVKRADLERYLEEHTEHVMARKSRYAA
jgi:hypothetical protein